MVILFVTPYLREKGEKPKGGGLETYLLRVAGALRGFGHLPIILAVGEKDLHYVENGIEFIFMQWHNVQIGKKYVRLILQRVCQSMAVNKKIKEITRKRKVDIIQFPSSFGLSSFYFGKTPAIMRLSSYGEVYYKDFFEKRKLFIWSYFEKAGASRCNAIFAPSNIIASTFSRDIHRKVSVIESPFWNEVTDFDNSIYDDKLSEKKYVLYFGRLALEKGILIIAECIQRFLNKNSEYYFVCCGQDNVIDHKSASCILKNATGKYRTRFIYMQQLSHDALYPIIQHADFVIMPSIAENLSNACMEAMYFERIVIGTEGTSYEQLIDDGISGLLCRPGDAEDLLNKMNQAALMDETRKREIGRNAKYKIGQFAPEYTVKKLIRYYEYVIYHCKNERSTKLKGM